MSAMDKLLRRTTGKAVDTLVHIGAGSGAVLDRYAPLSPSRAVLVEGDPEAAGALQRAARRFPWARVVAQATAGENGDVAWNRYNLPMLNGPVASDALATHYPRLRRQGTATVPGIALSSLLRSVLEDTDTDASTVLLLDVPGQEGVLLDSLGDALNRLTAVIVRRCALPLPEAVSWQTVQERMRDHAFDLVEDEVDDEPLWPVAAFTFDRSRHEAARMRAEVHSMQAHITRLRTGLVEARARSDGAEPSEREESTAPSAPTPAKRYFGLRELDRKLEAYLDFDNGYFVELGANDGVAQSNTLFFEKERGWRGVLIEPILHNFLKCRQNRSPDNAFFCAASVAKDYEQPFVRLTYSNLMTTPHGLESDIADPAQHARSGGIHLPAGDSIVDVMAPARTLGSMLDEADAPRMIDLLSLDVEGAEIEVLKGLDHQRHRFRYLLVESRSPERLTQYLTTVGYMQIDKLSHHDYLYALR